MLLFNTQNELISHLNSTSNREMSVGLVPTMGALHEGHLSLLSEACQHNAIVVISIFVNPTQFNNAEDLAKYPKTLDKDIEKIKTVSDDIIVFAPSVEDIYRGEMVSEHFDFDGLENQMEGKFRPGHFNGVGTIVKRLFDIVKPTNAYFGEKDFQQLQIIKKMVEKLKKQLGAKTIMLTLSEHGVYIKEGVESVLIPAHIRNISDVSGAGDTVISVATLCLAVGASPEVAASIANLAGGLVCEKTGVVPIDKNQLFDEVIKQYGE